MAANTIQYDSFLMDRVRLSEILRDIQSIVSFVVEVDNFTTFGAVKMMVGFCIGIIPPRGPLALDDIHDTDFRKRKQCPVYGIKGYIRKLLFDGSIHHIG